MPGRLSEPGSWKPGGAPRKFFHTFWGRPTFAEYEHDEYETLIAVTARHPVRPEIGLPLFCGLFAITLLAKNVLGMSSAGAVLVLLLFVFPCYVVQLLVRWRMRDHQKAAMRSGVKPNYVPSNPRGWAAVYIGTFMAAACIVVALDKMSAP